MTRILGWWPRLLARPGADAGRRFTLELLPGTLAICRLPADATIPAWARPGRFLAIVHTTAELSVTCAAELVPHDVVATRDWRALELRGPFEHTLVGILVEVATPLARAGVSIMPMATYDTDYVLVRAPQLMLAVAALRAAGHIVTEPAAPAG
jgi:hypothetical protein